MYHLRCWNKNFFDLPRPAVPPTPVTVTTFEPRCDQTIWHTHITNEGGRSLQFLALLNKDYVIMRICAIGSHFLLMTLSWVYFKMKHGYFMLQMMCFIPPLKEIKTTKITFLLLAAMTYAPQAVQIIFPLLLRIFHVCDMMIQDWLQQQWQSIWGLLLFCY